ncbi:replication endonuclease [Gluconacetobacter entanii]|uniref:Replication endonuclease n=1 Tax=Gluconacetobacter entanii TaxID=108528 RepID=A0ABT3K231_9PROT|nr:hypothetical protein [Gluconacetobacter entanii]MCW4589456.1 replication endonuclease [Gluconacetobacter entanii]MCW4593156.1 replication endonuclease [Gluconacetobacter entanii]NPC90305.1 hypothetical protein [Gluconacetobacter entanii]
MNIINNTENIKKKITLDVKKVFKPKSMFDLAREENKNKSKITAVKKPEYTPLSMWQKAMQEPKPVKPVIKRITRTHIPDLSGLSDTDPVDVIRDDGTPERWTIGELKTCLISHLKEYTRQRNTFAFNVLKQFPEFHEIEPITDLEPIADDDSEQAINWYQFGKNGHGKHHGKREHIKPSYDISDNDRAKRARLFRNRAILAGLEDFANTNGYRATFITITCDRDSIAQSKQCVSDLWNGLQKKLRNRKILNFGIKSFEQQKTGIWHIHAIIFTQKIIISDVETNIYPMYASHPHDGGECVQRIAKGTAINVGKYITKAIVTDDHNKRSSGFQVISESRFFGIPKGVIKSYDKVYKTWHDIKVFDDNQLSKSERKILAHIKAEMTPEQRKRFNHERFLKCHIRKRNMMTVLDSLGAFKEIKRPPCSWSQIKRVMTEGVKLSTKREQSKSDRKQRGVDKMKNINKKVWQPARGPPMTKIHNHANPSIEKRRHQMNNTRPPHIITGIPPPSPDTTAMPANATATSGCP